MESKNVDVRVSQLMVGDVMTSGTVTHAPFDSVDCPKGKINVGINGIRKTWNKSTTIRVTRNA